MKRNRKYKSINLSSVEDIPVKEIEKIPNLKNIIYSELYEAVLTANNTQDKVTLFEVNNSGVILELLRKNWTPALQKAVEYYEELEEFEKCGLYKQLINRINNESGSQQNNSSNREYVKRRNTDQEEKEKRSIS